MATTAAYYVAGAAVGVAEATVACLCPSLAAWAGLRRPGASAAGGDQQGAKGEASTSPAAAAVEAGGAGAPPGRALRHLSSFPVDDVAPDGSGESGPDAPLDEGEGLGGRQQQQQQARQQQQQQQQPATLRVPKLKLPAPGGRPDVAAGTDVSGPDASGSARSPASRLTEQNVVPLNAAFEAARARGGAGAGGSARGGAGGYAAGPGDGGYAGGGPGAPYDNHDAMTIATVNRYTYGLGPAEAAMATASAPVTPRSEATSDSALGGARRKKQGLFRGLRRKGQTPNQQIR